MLQSFRGAFSPGTSPPSPPGCSHPVPTLPALFSATWGGKVFKGKGASLPDHQDKKFKMVFSKTTQEERGDTR